jgi:D-3-phosphoglycerate dehydrogenase / 2-oxoglutarate reductase
MWKLLVTDEMRLGEVKHPQVRLDYKPGMTREELLQVIGGYDALITRSRTQVDAKVLEAGVRLKVVGRGGVGVDNVDLEAASRRGILVVNVPEANTRSAAELAWALLLAVARGVVESDQKIRQGLWDRKYLGLELNHKTLGIVGLGRIGGQVAKFAKGFDMRVLAYDPYIPRSRAQSLGVELLDDLADMLRQSHFLTVHTPLTEETRGMIGRRELYLLPKGAVVVNAARGGIVDEKALLEVLNDGHLWGAGLDVFAQEPRAPNTPWCNTPRWCTPPTWGPTPWKPRRGWVRRCWSGSSRPCRATWPTPSTPASTPRAAVFSAWLPLGEALGKLLAQITQGRPQVVEVSYYGDFEKNPDPIASAVAKGLLDQVLGAGATNLVSARPLMRDRGIALITRQVEQSQDYRQVLEVRLETDRETRKARGAVLGGKPRIVGIDDHSVEVVPSGHMLVCVNRDRPGVVGKVGTLLGENQINIAGNAAWSGQTRWQGPFCTGR